uniref:Ubiquitin-like-conjugating enzyme ATG10 n=1 Tax=Calidris pygmaea TaxID=425635 RepID=A0A8C3PJ82_9CHAR
LNLSQVVLYKISLTSPLATRTVSFYSQVTETRGEQGIEDSFICNFSQDLSNTLLELRGQKGLSHVLLLFFPSASRFTCAVSDLRLLFSIKDIAHLRALTVGGCFPPLTDGRPLTLDEIWKSVHACYQARLLEGPWDTITQQEHPLLGQPFFVLHPCRTNEFMSSLLTSTRKHNRHTNYIILWLSTVGPVVGLNLPLSYAKLAPEQSTNADSVERPLS